MVKNLIILCLILDSAITVISLHKVIKYEKIGGGITINKTVMTGHLLLVVTLLLGFIIVISKDYKNENDHDISNFGGLLFVTMIALYWSFLNTFIAWLILRFSDPELIARDKAITLLLLAQSRVESTKSDAVST